MACLIQKRVVNPHYKKIAPDTHFTMYHSTLGRYPKQDYYINVDCGRCINCFRKYMSSWKFRLLHEFYNLTPTQLKRSYFVTLTIENRFYTDKKPLLKKMVRRFLERVRKKYKKSIRHFLITERGEERNRYHFHGFFIDTIVPPNEFYNLWYYGFVKISPLNSVYPISQSVSYCTTYVTKGKKGTIDFVIPPEDFPLVLVSPGIGKSYVSSTFAKVHTLTDLQPMAFDFNGSPRSLPRYLRNKVFDESQLKLLKDDFFANFDDDVIPDPPYYIGNVKFDDYSVYLRECNFIKQIYYSIYGK